MQIAFNFVERLQSSEDIKQRRKSTEVADVILLISKTFVEDAIEQTKQKI